MYPFVGKLSRSTIRRYHYLVTMAILEKKNEIPNFRNSLQYAPWKKWALVIEAGLTSREHTP
jgi:hypothetical protein